MSNFVYCIFCGKKIAAVSVFCRYCGRSQENDNEADKVASHQSHEATSTVLDENTHIHGKKLVKERTLRKRIAIRSLKLFFIFAIAVAALLVMDPDLLQPKTSPDIRPQILPPKESLTGNEIALLSDSVLLLYVYDADRNLLQTGSGFIAFDDRTLVTNYHVIKHGYFVEAVSEHDVHYNLNSAIYFDIDSDIAILRFTSSTNLPVLPIANSTEVFVGDEVYAIGSPLGLINTVSNGIVSAIRSTGNTHDIQTTASISTGSSGGVLLNTYGEVIGITYAYYISGQNLSLAIPISELDNLQYFDTPQTFSSIAQFDRPIGNTFTNYSNSQTRLVEYGNMIYHSYNSDSQIIEYNKLTRVETRLNLFGTNLSIYRGVLYYISLNKYAISSYDLRTRVFRNNILPDYPYAAGMNSVHRFFITDYGFSVLFSASSQYIFMQLDFSGDIVRTIENISGSIVLADLDLLVGSRQTGVNEHTQNELVYIDLSSMEIIYYPIDIQPSDFYTNGDNYLYFLHLVYSDEWHVLSPIIFTLFKFDLYMGYYSEVSIPLWADDRTRRPYAINNGTLFYQTDFGTVSVDINLSTLPGIASALPGIARRISEDYFLDNMCFTDDGKIYATAHRVLQLPSLDGSQNTQYFIGEDYVRMNSNGLNLEVLDSRIVSSGSGTTQSGSSLPGLPPLPVTTP